MNDKPRVLICGTGFAGQGHTDAFRYAGCEVVGMYGRTESVVNEVSQQMKIPYSSSSWQQALTDCQPDIVSIGTPGGAHVEPIQQAIAKGCHVFCDKPLTQCGDTASELYSLAKTKRRKDRVCLKLPLHASHYSRETTCRRRGHR